jgi:hypothetical protein
MGVGSERHTQRLTPRKRPGTSCTGGWVGAENLAPTGISSPDLPARSESQYRQSYCDPRFIVCCGVNKLLFSEMFKYNIYPAEYMSLSVFPTLYSGLLKTAKQSLDGRSWLKQ